MSDRFDSPFLVANLKFGEAVALGPNDTAIVASRDGNLTLMANLAAGSLVEHCRVALPIDPTVTLGHDISLAAFGPWVVVGMPLEFGSGEAHLYKVGGDAFDRVVSEVGARGLVCGEDWGEGRVGDLG